MTAEAPASPGAPGHRTAARRWTRRAAWAALLLPVLLGGCQLPRFYGYRGQDVQGHDEFKLYAGTFIAAVIIGVIVAALILWAVFRYRRRDERMPRQFQYHIPLEITYTIIPVIIVLVLFAFTFVTENEVDAVPVKGNTAAVKVTVTAFQWGWKFDYTDQHGYVLGVQRQDPDPVGIGGRGCTVSAATPDDCLGPGLVLPANQVTEISLVSNDVIHAFYIPQFNFQRYAQPGVRNIFDLTPTAVGIYRAQCAELCGIYHSQMFFHVVVLPPATFHQWLTSGVLTSDGTGKPSTNGAAANNGLPPAYPPGSGFGRVVRPNSNAAATGTTVPSKRSSASSTPTSSTTSSSTTSTTTAVGPPGSTTSIP